MQPLRRLFFVALATIALGFACSSSQTAFAQTEDDVVVNEFVVNPATGKEYIELLVTNPAGVNMQGWTISDVGTRAGAAGATEGDVTLPAAAYLANVPQGTFVVIVLTTPAANTNTLVEDTSTTDGNRKLVLFTTSGVTLNGTIDNAASDNIQVYAGTRAAGTLIDQTLAGTNGSYITGATWGDNNGATTTDNINGGTGIPTNSAVRFVPTADTLAAYQGNDSGVRFAVDAASYGTPGAPNTGVPGDSSIFSGGSAPLIISEFRTFGPTEDCDEFIEIYNTSSSPYTVKSLAAGSLGFGVAQSNGSLLFTIPNNTIIPARGHYLAVNNGRPGCSGAFSYGFYPAGNGTTATGDNTLNENIVSNAGIAIFNTSLQSGFTLANRLDAVGTSAEANPLYREGTGYPPFHPNVNPGNGPEYSIFRKAQSGVPRDTNNNETDFQTASENFAEMCTSTANFKCVRLGAPGPENLSSPVQHNADIKASLVDPQCPGNTVNPTLRSACRFERRSEQVGYAPSRGTFAIRRRFTNMTGAPVTRLRFRIVEVSNDVVQPGIAYLRPITSPQVMATCQNESGTPHLCPDTGTPMTTIEGTTLETDQVFSNGGGINSSLSADTVTLANPLAPGESINVQFLFGVGQSGTFRFFVNVEALTSTPPPASTTKAQATRKARAVKDNK